MDRIEKLRRSVKDLYEEKRENRNDWCDWLYTHHVFIVADHAVKLAKKYGADPELSEAAALLHDLADATMSRFDPRHQEETLTLARRYMSEAGYTPQEILISVDDAVRLHSCYEGNKPKTTEGQVLATADSLAHLTTDFYVYASWALGRELSLAETKAWILKKIERDIRDKIIFEDERESARSSYEAIKNLFSR